MFDFAQAIEEVVFVETELDSDGDGSATACAFRSAAPPRRRVRGYKVPVVFEHSPYRGDFGDAVNHNVDFDVLPQENLFGSRDARARSARAARSKRTRAASARALPPRLKARARPARQLARRLLRATRLRRRAR